MGTTRQGGNAPWGSSRLEFRRVPGRDREQGWGGKRLLQGLRAPWDLDAMELGPCAQRKRDREQGSPYCPKAGNSEDPGVS